MRGGGGGKDAISAPQQTERKATLLGSSASAGETESYEATGDIVADNGFRPWVDGFGFENYDLVGRYRTAENGVPIDASGEIIGDNFRFNNLRELNDYLAGNDSARECMVRFMSYYAYGATGWTDAGCTSDAITAEARSSNWSILSVLTAITHAPHFTTRVQ